MVMKNGLFRITSFENDRGPSVMNHHEQSMVFFELLPKNRKINLDVYCRQLNKFNAAVKEKRPELVNRKDVIFYPDNATPYTSLATRQKLLRLVWEVMLHPLYSPDLTPSDYYLF